MKNAAPSALALVGLQFGYLLAGSILVETVFNWPGSGNLMNLAIFRRDIPVLQATILVLACFFVILNLAVDIAQAAIDGMEALAKNGLRYPFPQYGIQQDVRAGMAVSYPGRAS